MKARPLLSVLVPPALLTLVFLLTQIGKSVAWHSNEGYIRSLGDLFFMFALGIIIGFTMPLCGLIAGSGKLRINGSALLAGSITLVGSTMASIININANQSELLWIFTEVLLAAAIYGCLLLTASIGYGSTSKIFRIRWKETILLLSVSILIYIVGVANNYVFQNTPWNTLFERIDPRLARALTIRHGVAIPVLLLAALAVPVSLPSGHVKTVMKGYGVLFSLAALLLLAGYIVYDIEAIRAAPEIIINFQPKSILTKPFLIVSRIHPSLSFAILVMAGLCLKLGFGRSPNNSLAKC